MKFFLVITLATVCFGIKIDPLKYLKDYGYLQSNPNAFADNIGTAITNFQKFAHLPVSGILDDATIKMMQQPRCGVKDVVPGTFHHDVRKKRYVASSLYWENSQITYKFENYNSDLGKAATRRILAEAFETWSNVTNLSFTEVTGKATFRIRFEGGNHGFQEGKGMCAYPFDGQGGVLAHAFYPHVGNIHFDEDEMFTEGTSSGYNLFWVATHELGHALGLPHSDVKEALMYPWYTGYNPSFTLPADDTGAIRALYGCKSVSSKAVQIPQGGAPYDGLLMERWTNTVGDGIHHIEPDVCIYPHQPNSASLLSSFEAPSNSGDDFATRIRGYYKAEWNGYHYFFVCADHSAKLFISTSINPADKHVIAEISKPTGSKFRKCKRGKSISYMTAGQSYYIEAIHKDNSGDDYLKIGVRNNSDNTISLITSQITKWALTDTDIRLIICKGRYETLICPQSKEIEVVKAAYGLFTSNYSMYDRVKRVCNFDRWSKSAGTTKDDCAAKSSMQTVQAACQGRQQCTLYAHDSVFSDHCGKKLYSVLDVTYKCVSNGVTMPPKTMPPTTQPPTTTLPPTTQAPTTKICADTKPGCSSWARAGYCSRKYIREGTCPLSCGFCIGVTMPPKTMPFTTQPPTTQAPTTKICADTKPGCNSWESAGYCSHKHIREEVCPLSCGFCIGPSTAAPTAGACQDRHPIDCPDWKTDGYCRTSKNMREVYCRKTCGTCI